MHLKLTKHEGLGNDFLVLLDRDGDRTLATETIRRLCDRRRGIGADGVMRAIPGADVDAAMELFNADGSRAEMSGNGIRCLAQALLLEGWAAPPQVTVSTDAGVRTLTVIDGPAPEATDPSGGGVTHVLSVDMGTVTLAGDAPEWAAGQRDPQRSQPGAGRAAWANAGNPHLVIELADLAGQAGIAALDAVDLVELGEKVNAVTPGGANVHLLAPGPDPAAVTIRTFERGVGLTEACGTGACASAAVAKSWGLVEDDRVAVNMPGGRAEVALGAPVQLIGPATTIAAVHYPWPES